MRIKNMIKTAIMAAVIVVCTFISVPTPFGVPYTLQTLGVMLAGYILGSKKGAVAVLVYLILGAVGLPVFSSFTGGIGMLTGPTGGFLLGFILLALCCGVRKHAFLWGAFGVALCHILGTSWFSFYTQTSLSYAFLYSSLMFLPKDYFLMTTAYFLSKKIKGLYL